LTSKQADLRFAFHLKSFQTNITYFDSLGQTSSTSLITCFRLSYPRFFCVVPEHLSCTSGGNPLSQYPSQNIAVMAEEGFAGEQYSDHSLHLDTSALEQTKSEQLDDDFSPSPPSSSVAQSPITPGIPGSNSVSSEGRDIEPSKEPASGPQRLRSTSGAGGKGEREKRKRSRVTPEQLVHLERFFTMDRSPTAARRKEISDMLGMQERQTQIWFQNRRVPSSLCQICT
jgi:hypothetical protein